MDNNIEQSRYYQEYPLHHVASLGQAEAIEELLDDDTQHKNNVNQRNYDGVTPLHEACVNGHYNCVKLLLDRGAEVNARNIDSSTPLCDASASGSMAVLRLLLSRGADVNPQASSFTPSPLHEATLRGHAGCAQALVAAGADVSAHDCHYGTPLHVACGPAGSPHCARVLLDAGADVCATKILRTPLHYAAEHGGSCAEDLVRILIEYGANPHATDNVGRTGAQVALEGGNTDVWRLLTYHEKNAPPLLELCYRSIRRRVRYSECSIQALPLPPPLRRYLLPAHKTVIDRY